MRNLKKVLSLVLCMAMMLSVMVVGAGAAFKDQNKIVNDEAVDACAALNIINGYTDGSYRPEGNITRAEACKMICIALNGGKEPVLGTSATASFTDTKGHWAEGYIESCVAQGIVAGIGGGKFNPNGNVTGSQFAKMLLIALGFNAKHAEFLGNAWEVKVNVVATEKDLYVDLETMNPAVALTRDNAAQMVWNALNAIMVEYDYTLVSDKGSLSSQVTVEDKTNKNTKNDNGDGWLSLLEAKYEATVKEGIVTAVDHNTKGYTMNTTEGNFTKLAEDPTDMVGKAVKVLSSASDDVYGVYVDTDETMVVVKTYLGDINLSKDEYKLDGVTYDVDTDVADTFGEVKAVDTLGADLKTLSDVKAHGASTVALIDNNGDEEIDIAVVTPIAFGEVTYLGASNLTVNNGILTNKKIADCVLYDGIAKDDFVAVIDKAYVANDKYVVTALDKISGEVDALDDGDVRIDGAWYTNLTGKTYEAGVTDGDYYLYNGCIVMDDAKSGSISDTAYVIKVGSTFDVDGNYQVKVMINGDPQVVTAEVGTVDSTITTNTANTYCTYEIDDGVYQFKPVTRTNVPSGYTYGDVESYADKKLYSADNAKGTSYIIDADAVFFVQYKTDKYDTLTGAEVAAWGDNVKDLNGIILTKIEDGMTVVKGGALNLGSASVPTATATYGVITSSIVTAKDNKSEFTLWNGTDYIDVVTESTVSDLAKFDLVEYQKNADDTYDIVKVRDANDRLSITGWSETSGDIKLTNASGDHPNVVDEDTLVIFVNTDADVNAKEAGILGEEISVSAQPDGVNYNQNALSYTVDGEDAIDVLVIDTVNNTYAEK